jgi:hypothetical protein
MSASNLLTLEPVLRRPAVPSWYAVAGLKPCLWVAVLGCLVLAGHLATLSLHRNEAWRNGWIPPEEWTQFEYGCLVLLGVLAGAVSWSLRRETGAAVRRIGTARLVAWVGLVLLATTLVSRSPGSCVCHYAVSLLSRIANLGLLVLLIRSLPRARRAADGAYQARALSPVDRWGPWLAAGLTFSVSVLLAGCVFERVPHVPDEFVYLFQSRLYAAGSLYAESSPGADLVTPFLVAQADGKLFGVFPPGWPLVLALGSLVHLPWVVNPCLAALTVVVAHRLVRVLVDARTALLVAVLLAASPSFLFVSASMMSHTLCMLCGGIALLGLHGACRSGRILPAVLSGMALGAVACARPIEGVAVGIIAILFALVFHPSRIRPLPLLSLLLSAGLVSTLFLLNNWVLTGDPLRDPVQSYFDSRFFPGCNRYGFGPDCGNLRWPSDLMPGHSPLEALLHVHLNFSLMDVELFGWSFGSLLFAAFPLFCRPWTVAVKFLAAWVLVIALAAAPYWYSGADLGARYWYPAVLPLAILSVLGVQSLGRELGLSLERVWAFVVLASLLGAACVVPWRGLGKYHHYRGVRGEMAEVPLPGGIALPVRSTD